MVKSDPYPGLHLKKGECVGHVQKRVGTELRALKANKKESNLAMVRHFRKRKIDRKSNKHPTELLWDGHNKGKLLEKRKAVGTVLCHCSAIKDPETRHQFCPRSEESW